MGPILRSYTHYKWWIVPEYLRFDQFVLGYHWLPLATIDLVGDNRELDSLRQIMRSYTIMGGSYSQNIEGATLFALGYHWLPLATIDLVGDNRELEVWGLF